MSGGHVVGFPIFQDAATFLYSGGTFDFFGIPQDPQDLSSDPSLDGAAAGQAPDVLPDLPGFTAREDAEIQFIGHDLQSILVDPSYAYGDSILSVYQLTGRLADGTTLDGGLVYVDNASTARFLLVEAPVPEPSTVVLALLAIGGTANCLRRRAPGVG
jgi:hypothetical protein